MKIAGIRAHCLASELATPFAFSQGWVKSRGACLVEVQTDAGLIGWGEALCQGLQPGLGIEVDGGALERLRA